MKRYAVKTCPICGQSFGITGIGNNSKKYCSKECGRIAIKIAAAERKEYSRPRSDIELSKVCIKAKKAGLSYGQYVAREYLKHFPVGRNA